MKSDFMPASIFDSQNSKSKKIIQNLKKVIFDCQPKLKCSECKCSLKLAKCGLGRK